MNTTESEADIHLQKFLVIGIITSEDFQKTKYAIHKLHKSFPKEFGTPDIRPMLDVEWNEFLTKYRRRLGDGLWSIKNRVAIFKNGEFLGDFSDFNEFIWRKWMYVFNQNWHELAVKDVIEYLDGKKNQCLYNDVVPLACENFLNRCKNESDGYAGSSIHRIVNHSWIQCGGYDLEPIRMPCENYVVAHDRRGVLSMTNNGPHKSNSTQFFISLDSAPWMNYRYVAFGQLLQGDDVLKTIEEVPTYYQAPTSNIVIVKCGEFKTKTDAENTADLYTTEELDQWKDIQQQVDILSYLKTYNQVVAGEGQQDTFRDLSFPRLQESCDSILFQKKIKSGTYSLKSDLKPYSPFSHLPDISSDYGEGAENYDICGPEHPITTYNHELYDDSQSIKLSDITL